MESNHRLPDFQTAEPSGGREQAGERRVIRLLFFLGFECLNACLAISTDAELRHLEEPDWTRTGPFFRGDPPWKQYRFSSRPAAAARL